MHGGIDHRLGVLFVCLGNICRSPIAEGALRESARLREFACLVDSAGTASYHIGSKPNSRAIAVAARHRVDIAGQSARQIEQDDFYRFTNIITLDRANLEGVRARAPRDGTARLSMLLNAVESRAGQGVADLYYGDDAAFEAAWEAISIGVEAWLARLQREAATLRA
jgi:protein-tyrosine phosphatase